MADTKHAQHRRLQEQQVRFTRNTPCFKVTAALHQPMVKTLTSRSTLIWHLKNILGQIPHGRSWQEFVRCQATIASTSLCLVSWDLLERFGPRLASTRALHLFEHIINAKPRPLLCIWRFVTTVMNLKEASLTLALQKTRADRNAMGVGQGTNPLSAASRRTTPAPFATTSYTASVLPRSTISMNPFSHIRRKLTQSRSNKEQAQLFEELLQSLEDYIGAFVPLSPGDEVYVKQSEAKAPLSPCPTRIGGERLRFLVEELNNTVRQIIDKFPDFRHCLIVGAYGPYFLPMSASLKSDNGAFSAHEPSYAEIISGQWWAVRLRKDLRDCFPHSLQIDDATRQGSSSSLSAPVTTGWQSARPSTSPPQGPYSADERENRMSSLEDELKSMSISKDNARTDRRSAIW